VCISWIIKCLILLMHGANMKFKRRNYFTCTLILINEIIFFWISILWGSETEFLMVSIQLFGISTSPAMVCYMTTVTFSTDSVILLLSTTSILLLFLVENFILREWERSEKNVKPAP